VTIITNFGGACRENVEARGEDIDTRAWMRGREKVEKVGNRLVFKRDKNQKG
jgi:hypothetical protein